MRGKSCWLEEVRPETGQGILDPSPGGVMRNIPGCICIEFLSYRTQTICWQSLLQLWPGFDLTPRQSSLR